MAGEAEHEDDELFEPTEELDGEGQEGQDQDGEGEEPETDEEETIIGFGEDDPGEQDESEPFRKVRQRLREVEAENRELRQSQPAPKAIEVGTKPSLESCEYDEDRFTDELLAWNGRKTAAEAQAKTPDQRVQAAIDGAAERYKANLAKLRRPDFDQAVSRVKSTLTEDQIAGVVLVAENAPAFLYALSRSQARMDRLAETDPSRLAYVIGALEKDLRVTTKKRAVEPEGIVRGSASTSAGKDKHEDRLAREADRTGDRTKLIAYRKSRNQGSR